MESVAEKTRGEDTVFRSGFSEAIFQSKYAHEGAETWPILSRTLMEDVGGGLMARQDIDFASKSHSQMKFLAGGRYIYYAGRPVKYFNNCYLLRGEEDTREEWAGLVGRSSSCLLTGGGIGTDYSIFRGKGAPLNRTGGVASGPIALMKAVNECGRQYQQGGSRRSALYASLNWQHPDIRDFIHAKDWYDMPVGKTGLTIGHLKEQDFNFAAPLDMTNISPNYDNDFLEQVYLMPIDEIKRRYLAGEDLVIRHVPETFLDNVRNALKTGEPGFSFNFFEKVRETLRNACTEITSEDDSDVCNLASLNLARIDSKEEFRDIVHIATKFLLCGTIKAQLPYEKVSRVREKNRRLGLGLMGVHEWLLKRGYRYEVVSELKEWLQIYQEESDKTSREFADRLGVSRPVANRAIAPTGTIGIMACTTTGIEPLFSVSYKRRYLKADKWRFQYVVDGTAKVLIQEYGLKPDDIETAVDLAKDYERRMQFQADIQDFVDQGISSTINLPSWGTRHNNEDMVEDFAVQLLKRAHRLRGFTVYPDGSRGGQPITPVPYNEAIRNEGMEFEEAFHDICEIGGKSTCEA